MNYRFFVLILLVILSFCAVSRADDSTYMFSYEVRHEVEWDFKTSTAEKMIPDPGQHKLACALLDRMCLDFLTCQPSCPSGFIEPSPLHPNYGQPVKYENGPGIRRNPCIEKQATCGSVPNDLYWTMAKLDDPDQY
ncbi:unnamed protein product, partial [Mesorhabditis spiculigera]